MNNYLKFVPDQQRSLVEEPRTQLILDMRGYQALSLQYQPSQRGNVYNDSDTMSSMEFKRTYWEDIVEQASLYLHQDCIVYRGVGWLGRGGGSIFSLKAESLHRPQPIGSCEVRHYVQGV